LLAGKSGTSALEAFEPATLGTVAPGFAAGSRFKGSIRDGLNGTVADFAVGSRFKGSVRDGFIGTVGPGFAAACGRTGPEPCRAAFGLG
jgi:hypothetical protein